MTDDVPSLNEMVPFPYRGEPEKSLWRVVTGYWGESYERAYVWAEDEQQARSLFAEKHPGREVRDVDRLFSESDEPFVTELSDSGFQFDEE